MKKWIYLIVPFVGMALFMVVYLSYEKQRSAKELARKEAVAQKQADEKKRKDEAEQKAREDAAKKQAEREAEEKKKEEERRAKLAKQDAEIKADIDAARAEADKFAKDAQSLEIQLDRLRKDKDRMMRETFDLLKQVELARVARRNAELEAQRMLETIGRRVADSNMTRPPPPPPAPKS